MKNKGFSLVELIIVIAIMAILAAAIAPALIRYIDKSRKSDDLAAAETINTGVNAALANEDGYSEVANAMGDGTDIIAEADAGDPFTLHSGATVGNNATVFLRELNSNIGGNSPKLKFTKSVDGTKAAATGWQVAVQTNGKAVVYLDNGIELQPEIDASYK